VTPAARTAAALGAILLWRVDAAAHVNSPHIYLEEKIGPYAAIVVAHMPPAMPGEAEVQVRLSDRADDDPIEVWAREIPPAGDATAPEWRRMRSSEADPSYFTAPIPFTLFGLWHEEIRVKGSRGEGVMRFPMPARVPMPSTMAPALAATLTLLVGLLYVSQWQLLTDIGRDATLPPGARPSPADARRGRTCAITGTTLLTLFFALTGVSWTLYDARQQMLGSPRYQAELSAEGGPVAAGRPATLRLVVRDRRGNPPQGLIPDHGKLMHLVITKDPGAGFFLHAHPRLVDAGRFELTFMPPEAGTYRVFGDLLFDTGESTTITARIDVTSGHALNTYAPKLDDEDDSWARQAPIGTVSMDARSAEVGDGLSMRWVDAPSGSLSAETFHKLAFELVGPDGQPVASIEPYMGMAGHLLIVRDDMGVFVHAHPTGTIGGRMAMLMRQESAGMGAMHQASYAPRVTFPYAFPYPGRYRMWAQVKYAGVIRTGVFDVDVR